MHETSDKNTAQQGIGKLKQVIEKTYRRTLEVAYKLNDPSKTEEVNTLKQEVEKLSAELKETYRGVIQLATNLEHEEQKVKLLTEGAGLGLWEWSTTDDSLQVNDEWLAITGLMHDEFRGTLADWDKLVHPDDLPRVKRERNKFLKGERPFFRCEYRIKSDKDNWIWVLSNAKAAGVALSNSPQNIAGTLLNIDKQKQTELKNQQLNNELEQRNQERTREIEHINHQLLEEIREHQLTVHALRQANQHADEATSEIRQLSGRLSLAVTSAHMGIWDWDIVNDHLHWDDKMYSLYGLDKNEDHETYQRWEQSLHPDDSQIAQAALQKAINDNIDFDTEFRVTWPDGSIRYMKANARAQRDDAGRAIRMIGVNYDITDRKKMEFELLHAKQAADAANQAKSAFLTNMSHELRTPLQSILGFSQLMQYDSSLSMQHIKNLGIINRSGNHLHELINDVLEISEIEAGHVKPRPIEFDLNQLVEEMKESFGLQIETKSLYLNIAIGTNTPQYVKADVVKLRQILINLIGNAIKFTDTGGICLRLGLAKESNLLEFEIEDSGPGISDSEYEQLFQPFGQGLAGIGKGGSGLGLVITREYVQLLGGELTINTTPGKGSCFSFSIPFTKVKSTSQLKLSSPQFAIGLKSGTASRLALVVDSQQQNLSFMLQLLTKMGFEAIATRGGKQALNEAKARKPDVILMSLSLADMEGYEAIRLMRKLTTGKHVPIIAMTANTYENNLNVVHKSGADDLLIKPFKLQQITGLLARIPGIDFIYDNDNNSQVPQTTPAPSKNALSILPADLRLKLRTATENGDIENLRACIKDIGKKDHKLAANIGGLVERFEYNKLLEILN